ncbi:hypothetical protein KKC56_02440 [Patescibacteria group bacterium]|nr:hypothetical protein [Patescibacteria group bacterium]MBU1684300.1 hypothetical protein [Patescibacteria group bacterium]MBU1987729.1 hypothetical protein [Patescibacteria group bacterium]
MDIKRKWQWIMNKLCELKLDDLATQAEKFDKFLQNTFTYYFTEEWLRDYARINKKYHNLTTQNAKILFLLNLMTTQNYCVACAEDQFKCSFKCLFGQKFGVCKQPTSDFFKLFKKLRENKEHD